MSKKISFQNLCNVNIAVGLTALDRYNEALALLARKVNVQVKNGKMFEIAYCLVLMDIYINLGDWEKATQIYEENMKEIRKNARHPRIAFALDATLAAYQYKANETAETAAVYLSN